MSGLYKINQIIFISKLQMLNKNNDRYRQKNDFLFLTIYIITLYQYTRKQKPKCR